MTVKYESNGNITENPFQVNLLKDNGELEDYFLIKGEFREKITLADLIDKQVEFVKQEDRDSELHSSGDYAQIGSSGYADQIGSSGDYAQIGSSGDSARIGSSGGSAQIGSSGDYAQIGSSGYSAQIGSSGDSARIGSSGYSAQIGSSGDYAQIGSSGDYAQIGSSGYSAQIGSSGYAAQIGSSGDYARIGSSGNYAQIGSSGDSAQIGSSGNYAQIGSSGDSAQIGSSGYSAQIGSSGNYARIGSSGDYAQIGSSGDYAVGFACGFNSIIKAKVGTWISLCEYKKNEDGQYIPAFALSAQIGNSDYKDCYGKILNENDYYMLINKQFTPIIIDDGMKVIKINSKTKDGLEIIKCKRIDNDNDFLYCVRKGELSAHGETLHEAMEDLTFKEMKNRNVDEIVENIKSLGYVTRADYRAITGACQFGTEEFCKEKGIEDLEKIELEKLLSILDDGYFGARVFKELFE